MKKCSKCNLVKNKDMFHVDKSRKSGLKSSCKSCRVKKGTKQMPPKTNKTMAEKKAEKRKHRIYGKYKIRVEDYNEMFLEQGGCCAICGSAQKILDIDHCHSSGKVRALLCRGCNVGIGHFKESQKSLYEAIKYLKRFEEK